MSANMEMLVVEDNPLNMKLLVGILRRLGFQPDTVDNGAGAIEQAAEKDYDLILMDVMMNGIDGLEATRQIRKLPIKQPVIIAVTANTMAGEREKCIEAGMDDYSVKPISIQQIRSIIDSAEHIIAKKKERSAMGPDIEEIPILDLEVIESLQFLAEDGPEFIIETIDLFAEKGQECLDGMQEGRAAGDAVKVAKEAHSLRGSGANVGVGRLAGLLRKVEQHAKEGNLEAAIPYMDLVPALYAESLIALRKELGLPAEG